MLNSETAVLVVGAGPVGLATAAMLRRHGAAVRIVDRSTGPTPYSKAVGMHARTLEAMHALGLTEQLVSDGQPLADFRVVDAGTTILEASFAGMGSAYEFVLGIAQSRTERRLLARLRSGGADVEWQTEFLGLGQAGDPHDRQALAEVRLQRPDGREERVRCRWVVAADGGRSPVRQSAGIRFEGGDYGNAFILGDACIDWQGPREKLQFFLSPHGYLLLVPMPKGLHRIIAQTDHRYEDFQGAERPQASLEELQQIVDRNGPGGIRVHSPQWLTSAPFYHRQASAARAGRVVLAGDALHLFSPLGAQGLNTGFQDAFNLAWKIAYIENGLAPTSLIDSYCEERLAMARRVAAVTTRTTRYITATQPLARIVRHVMTRALSGSNRVQRRLPQLLAGLLQAYDAGPNAPGQPAGALPTAGGRVPHAWVADGLGYRPLAAHIHGTAHTLLLVVPRMGVALVEALRRFCEQQRARLPFLQVCVVTREIDATPSGMPPGVTVLEDRLGEFGRALGHPASATVLVRPDGYCALSAAGLAFEDTVAYCAQRGLGALVLGAQCVEVAHA